MVSEYLVSWAVSEIVCFAIFLTCGFVNFPIACFNGSGARLTFFFKKITLHINHLLYSLVTFKLKYFRKNKKEFKIRKEGNLGFFVAFLFIADFFTVLFEQINYGFQSFFLGSHIEAITTTALFTIVDSENWVPFLISLEVGQTWNH
jgi:hypothetical protein